MLAKLNENEFKAAADLINGGLDKAKQSMEMILQSPISLSKIDYNEAEHDVPQFLDSTDDETHLLKTELKGQLKGSCYLIFTKEEVKKITAACLPATLDEESEMNKMMKMEFLKEVDNMVAAAVVTQFANILGLEIYGDVPGLHIMKAKDVPKYLESESTEFDSIIHFKANFIGAELEINPDFVWIFNEKFLDKIKELV